MKEIKSDLNKHTFTACVASAKNTAVFVRATEEEAEEVRTNKHIDIVLKNIFSGTSEIKTIQVDELELDLDDTGLGVPNLFGLYIPLTGDKGCFTQEDIINLLPKGWKPDDPCITTHALDEDEWTLDDYIINLRTEEIIFFMGPDYVTKIHKTSNVNYPKVSGEAQLICSMFLTHLETDFIYSLYKGPLPSGIDWYEELGKEDVVDTTNFFSEKRSTIEDPHGTILRCFENALLETEDSVIPDPDSAIDIMDAIPGLYEYYCKSKEMAGNKASDYSIIFNTYKGERRSV